ncbi:MAG: helix-turn-helix domain-containing protein [Candidatus Woesearchaeota archaeon]
MAEFPNRLKELRGEKNITQNKLAEHLGVSRSTIAGYETGKRKPEYETLQKLANYFSVSVDYLIGNTDEMKPAQKIKQAISDDPELVDFWDKLSQREDLKMMFKQTKDLPPKTVKQVIRIIKAIEEEEDNM